MTYEISMFKSNEFHHCKLVCEKRKEIDERVLPMKIIRTLFNSLIELTL